MAVLIEGMERPKQGIVINIYADGRVTNHFDEFGTTIGKAVSIPPHGRLIDADAMFKDICDSIDEMTTIGVAVDGQWLWNKLNDTLENAPTIIPASKEGEA